MNQRLNTCAALFLGITSLTNLHGALRATLDGGLQPIWDLEIEEYPVTVVYESRLPIDQATLGNDDLYLGTGPHSTGETPDDLPAFLGGNGFGATVELRKVHSVNAAGTKLSVDYVFKRPSRGWENISNTRIKVVAGTVADVAGAVNGRHELGEAYANLETVATLISSKLEVSQDSHAFQIRYQNPSGISEADIQDIQVAMTSNNNKETMLGVEPQLSPDILIANYELSRPSDGWKSDIWFRISYPAESDNADAEELDDAGEALPPFLQPRPGGVTEVFEYGRSLIRIDNGPREAPLRSINSILDYIEWRRLPDVDVSVDSSPLIHPVETLNRFNVHFRTTGKAFDLSSFGDGNVEIHTDYAFRRGDSLKTKLVSLVENPDEIVATYEIVPPANGWDEMKKDASGAPTHRTWSPGDLVPIVLIEDQVLLVDGTSVPSKVFNDRISLDLTSDSSPLQSDFEAWTQELMGALGVTAEEAIALDTDGDGLTAPLEYALARNPLKADTAAPLTPKRVRVGDAVYLELKYRQRMDAKGIDTRLEGSLTGEDWQSAQDDFEVMARDEMPDEHAVILTLRSKKRVTELTDRLFRLHAVLPDND